MSRSYVTGWLAGLVVSALALAVLSLAVPLSAPQDTAGVAETTETGEAAAAGAEPATETAGTGDASEGGGAPAVTIVEVPEGSEFAGQPSPADAEAPAAGDGDAAPAPGTAPQSEAAPALVETQPAAAPAAETAEAPAAPGPVALGDTASEPSGEQPAATAPEAPDLGATEAAETGPAYVSGAGMAGGPPTPGQSVAIAEPVVPAPAAAEEAPPSDTTEAAQPEPAAGAEDAAMPQVSEASAPEAETVAEAPEATAVPEPTAEAEEATMPQVSDATATDEEAVAEALEIITLPEPTPEIAGADVSVTAPADSAEANDQGGVPGVTILRLPGTGEEAAEGQEDATDAAAVEPADAGPAVPLAAYSAAWSNPEGLPALAIVLLDIGPERGGATPEMIAALPFAATIAIDPQRADAAASAAAYRAAGSEVALLVETMPAGATPADLEVAYQSFVQSLPQSVALVGNPQASFLRSSLEAQHVAALLAADGRGLVTYQAGLNLARRAAERAGTPVATIEKLIDPVGTATGAVGRELDRAAFNATQKGTAVIALPTTPDLMAALAAWASSPSAASVSLAPVSALMLPEMEAGDPPAAVPAEPLPDESGSALPGQKVGTFTDTN